LIIWVICLYIVLLSDKKLIGCKQKKRVLIFALIVQASNHPFSLTAEEIDKRLMERMEGELLYLNGDSLIAATTMNKAVHQSYVLH
jgi:hypothetical protein